MVRPSVIGIVLPETSKVETKTTLGSRAVSRLKAIGSAILFLMATGWDFQESGLRVRILWLFRWVIRYEQIVSCGVRTSHREYLIFSLEEKEIAYYAVVMTVSKWGMAFRFDDPELFVSQLRQHAPHVVFKMLDRHTVVRIGRKRPEK